MPEFTHRVTFPSPSEFRGIPGPPPGAVGARKSGGPASEDAGPPPKAPSGQRIEPLRSRVRMTRIATERLDSS